MGINFYSKKILKFLTISFIIPFSLFEINTINKQVKADILLYVCLAHQFFYVNSDRKIVIEKGQSFMGAPVLIVAKNSRQESPSPNFVR